MTKSITINIDEALLSRVEQKAATLNSSISEVVSDYLRQWAAEGEVSQARVAMIERFASSNRQFAVGVPDNRSQRNARHN